MNYNTIQAVIDAGITNMTQRIGGTKYDDNTYTISNPPSWLKYNGLTASNIYVSGNSWIGINSTTEHIKFNRRDTAMYYLWTEEGTICGTIRFYKIRWRGTTTWNGSEYYTWEVLFVDTGDLMIHLVESASFSGTFDITTASATYTYTAPTASNPYVSFYSQDDSHTTFTIAYELLRLTMPWDDKWLISSNNVFYNVIDNALHQLSISGITAQNMLDYGNDTAPAGDLLKTLVDPKVYHWNNSPTFIPGGVQPTITTNIAAIPYTQTIACTLDLSDSSIIGIANLASTYNGNVQIRYSVDNGSTYTNNMSMADFLAISPATLYASLPANKQIIVNMFIANGTSLTNVIFNLTNPGV